MKCRHCVIEAVTEIQGSHYCTFHAMEREMQIAQEEASKVRCPACGKVYKPTLGMRDPNDNRLIQEIYPNATPEEREQRVSGCCSDECWDKWLGIDEDGNEYGY